MPCAIKTTKAEATLHDRMEFLNEAQVMKKYKSHHIIELYGERTELRRRKGAGRQSTVYVFKSGFTR